MSSLPKLHHVPMVPPTLPSRERAALVRNAPGYRQRDPWLRPQPLRERPSRFAIPPPRTARTAIDLGPSMAMRSATLGPLSTAYQDCFVARDPALEAAQALASAEKAKELKAKTLKSDVFFVESKLAREAADTARELRRLDRDMAERAHYRAGQRHALASFHRHQREGHLQRASSVSCFDSVASSRF